MPKYFFRDNLTLTSLKIMQPIHENPPKYLRNRIVLSRFQDEQRDWRIWQDLGLWLIAKARKLYESEDLGLELDNSIYALDSTTIDLCLKLFPWADFRSTKAGTKMHTQLDLRGSIPSVVDITPAKKADVKWLDDLVFEAGSFYIMDRGYIDFERLFRIAEEDVPLPPS